jgi:predicted Na+-dependent transporter
VQSYGNWTLALILCILSNALGVATMPFYLKAILSSGDVSVDAIALLVYLIISALAPLVIAKIIRDNWKTIRDYVAKNDAWFWIYSNTHLLCIVWQAVSKAQVTPLTCSPLLITPAGCRIPFPCDHDLHSQSWRQEVLSASIRCIASRKICDAMHLR